LSLITVAFSSFNVGWVRKWTLFGGLSTGTFTNTVLRLTVSFDAFRNAARSSKMAEGSLLGTTLRSGVFAWSSAILASCRFHTRKIGSHPSPRLRQPRRQRGEVDSRDTL